MATPAGVYILDTSFFFIHLSLDGDLITVPRVVEELKDLRSRARLAVLESAGLRVCDPSPSSFERVQAASNQSGDASVLSATDQDLLALALDREGILVTDDFAIQNTAKKLGIPVRPILQRKAKARLWNLRCTGCGKTYETMPPGESCPDCGATVRRKIK